MQIVDQTDNLLCTEDDRVSTSIARTFNDVPSSNSFPTIPIPSIDFDLRKLEKRTENVKFVTFIKE